MKKIFVSSVYIAIIFCTSFLHAQSFTTSPYITIPGNNSQIDVITKFTLPSFICWVNQYGSAYNIYLRQTSPDSGKNILIFSDTNQITNPKISFIDYSNNIRIVWQSFINNHWQILSREIINDTLSDVVSITDSLNDNITPALGTQILAWIQNGKLLLKYLDSASTPIITLDSVNCSNPIIGNGQYYWYGQLYVGYEKGTAGNRQIYSASYTFYANPEWVFTKISSGGDNININIGTFGSPQNFQPYQTMNNGVWKIVSRFIMNDTSDNVSCNCENPSVFLYILLTKNSARAEKKLNNSTPFFIVYDTDSLKSNREIMLKFDYEQSNNDTTINLSNSPGDDYKPEISFYSTDTTYVAVFWTHEQNGKQGIWMSKTFFSPITGFVPGRLQSPGNYSLEQNYPNPFNPSTIISYQLPVNSKVVLKIYDLLGKEVATLVNKEQLSGSYHVQFDGSKFASGVYFYRIEAGSFVETRKLILIK